ncbi:MAG: FHA domain-containing protein [Anaerolineae bacterium]|nr:FHA domain-containing protein [Anaerolineae bacterium]
MREFVFHIQDSDEPIVVPLEDELVLGRYDPVSRTIPDIDLSQYQAVGKKVSRLHAVIRRQNDRLYVMDLGSVHGSYLNDERLRPHQARTLNDGDKLQLGNLVTYIYVRENVLHED